MLTNARTDRHAARPAPVRRASGGRRSLRPCLYSGSRRAAELFSGRSPTFQGRRLVESVEFRPEVDVLAPEHDFR
ncbi:hypothetical protein EVAR_27623_1 [Eumeta japonica]|uniref:Uncharacterized protein n=1 Tax=Eumeta variegata TaxID=151549 RepID=A0A4C1V119_EUMVA|nr:hypothetical protein EVAR_27623_1 [Eumeta japonica]